MILLFISIGIQDVYQGQSIDMTTLKYLNKSCFYFYPNQTISMSRRILSHSFLFRFITNIRASKMFVRVAHLKVYKAGRYLIDEF